MNKKQILTTSLGNTLEWFDFGLFIFMAPLIGAAFFHQQSVEAGTLEAYTVFAAGFICRPLGGILFGHIGDTQGRAKTLRISVLLIALSTLLVGLLPDYKTIGILAPILFTLLRLAQGISIGGEYSGVMIYLAESAPKKQRGLMTSFAATGANLGFLLATIAFLIIKSHFNATALANWAWRIPFLLAGIPGFIVLYFRFKLKETNAYTHLKSDHAIVTQPFITALTHAPLQLLKIFGLTCMSASFYYVFFGYMPTYLELYVHVPSLNALLIQSCLLAVMLFIVPFAGYCGDLLSRKMMLTITAVGVIITALPCFYLLQTNTPAAIILALCVATLLTSIDQGNSLAAIVENCPANIRYSGIAFSYNLGNALFGGTAPLIVTLLTQHISLTAPAYYLIVMATISLFAISKLLGNNKSMPAVTIRR